MSATSAAASVSVVLVHGGFVDGSGWQGVYNILRQHGYRVSIVQNPTVSLDDDVAVTRRVIAAQPGPVVLVGHSYGGVVVTQAGNDPKVAGLVYIAAFAPDKANRSPPSSPIRRPAHPCRRFFLRRTDSSCSIKTKFAASFAADVPEDPSRVHGELQVPWGVQALEGTVSEPAWKSKPSWYLVATDDRMIRPRSAVHVEASRLNGGRVRRVVTPSTSRSRRPSPRSSKVLHGSYDSASPASRAK